MELTELQTKNFWNKVDKTGDCWEWTGSKEKGYGSLWVEGKRLKSNRISWFIQNGDIPEGLLICHHCDNRACVKPSHLYAGTHKDNAIDMASRFRQALQKLRASDIPVIMSYRGILKQREIAEIYGVHQVTIGAIFNGRSWSHVTGIVLNTSKTLRGG